jgi:3D (Asp-Asp-Asp) domain-containing protein
VRSLATSGATRVAAVLASLAAVAAVPVALGADPSDLRARAAELRTEASSAEARAQTAVLTLYALETELERARAEVSAAEARRAAIAGERASARRQLALARSSMRVSERRLAELVRTVYEQDGADPLAVVLGAGSLDEAVTGLDNLDRAARENGRVLEQLAAAQTRLEQLEARLDARARELLQVSEGARNRLRTLEAKRAERAAYIGSLRRLQGLTAQRISGLEAQAEAAEQRTAELQVAAVQPLRVPATSPRTLTVSAVGYSLRGRTASGLPVGPGIVAVDPTVIPLGTRMFVPGYGEAVAADTGSAVQGAAIDLWFPSTAAALRWGRQTVVITLH